MGIKGFQAKVYRCPICFKGAYAVSKALARRSRRVTELYREEVAASGVR